MVGYADDLLLLAPSVKAAQLMLKACEEFAAERNIRFSTNPDVSKSKCKAMIMSESRIDMSKVPSLILCGEKLPFVERCDHLGHTLTSNGKMTQDSRQKLAAFIDSTVKIRKCFSFAHPDEQIKAMEKSCFFM